MIIPQMQYTDKDGTSSVKFFKTYRELKKNLTYYLHDSINHEIFVIRSRRGEWGEWCEYWALRNNKPVIIKKVGVNVTFLNIVR